MPDTAKPDDKRRVYIADFTAHKARADKAWSDRDPFQKLYNDACEFGIPYRQDAEQIGKGAQRLERVFDSTAIDSAFRAAGQLHQDLFPPDFFKLAPGPIAKAAGKQDKDQLAEFARQLELVTLQVMPFFQTGEFDTASAEMCIDLLPGTGVLFPVEGDDRNPVRWICIPFSQIALACDAYGRVVLIVWRCKQSYRAIKTAFPKGAFPSEFEDAYKATPDSECELRQDFVEDPATGNWTFVAYVEKSTAPITEDQYRVQPMATPRFHRVPGEAYGRGRLLLALPTIKTLNKATELTLKAAAIQLLGIWGYRPGGSFNPDTVRLGPGEFWPMQGTGGVLGPDVTRLDTSSGKVDVGTLITSDLRQQVQSMLGDDRLPADGATPRSATEIMERIKRISQNQLGAYGRVVNETVPVLVRRVVEILYRRKLIAQDIQIDDLLIKVDVISPIAAAVKAAAHSRMIDFLQLVISLKGDPLAANLIVYVDETLRTIGNDFMPASLMVPGDTAKDLERTVGVMATKIAAQMVEAQKKAGAAAVSEATA